MSVVRKIVRRHWCCFAQFNRAQKKSSDTFLFMYKFLLSRDQRFDIFQIFRDHNFWYITLSCTWIPSRLLSHRRTFTGREHKNAKIFYKTRCTRNSACVRTLLDTQCFTVVRNFLREIRYSARNRHESTALLLEISTFRERNPFRNTGRALIDWTSTGGVRSRNDEEDSESVDGIEAERGEGERRC